MVSAWLDSYSCSQCCAFVSVCSTSGQRAGQSSCGFPPTSAERLIPWSLPPTAQQNLWDRAHTSLHSVLTGRPVGGGRAGHLVMAPCGLWGSGAASRLEVGLRACACGEEAGPPALTGVCEWGFAVLVVTPLPSVVSPA